MSYQHTDIFLCLPGIGKTFYAQDKNKDTEYEFRGEKRIIEGAEHSQFMLCVDVVRIDDEFIRAISEAKNTHRVRYILLPMDMTLRLALHQADLPYLVVSPKLDDKQAWIKRWLKAGATAELIRDRLKKWDATGHQLTHEIEWIYLEADEWLGNILQQTPLDEADGKDA